MKGVPAQTLRSQGVAGGQHKYGWEPCVMMAYNAATTRYDVSLTGSGATVSVPRIYLLFDAEDPEVFAQRVSAACELRKQTEGHLRYSLCADCMPADSAITDLDAAMGDRLVAAFTGGRFTQAGGDFLDGLLREVNASFSRATNTMVLQHVIHHDPENFTTLMPPPVEVVAAPGTGMIPVPAYDFAAAARRLGTLSFIQAPAVITLLSKVLVECQKAAAIPLFNLNMVRQPFEGQTACAPGWLPASLSYPIPRGTTAVILHALPPSPFLVALVKFTFNPRSLPLPLPAACPTPTLPVASRAACPSRSPLPLPASPLSRGCESCRPSR